MKNFSNEGQIIDVKISHFDFFSAIIELVRELHICSMHNTFEEDTWKTFMFSPPQCQVIYVRCEKSE